MFLLCIYTCYSQSECNYIVSAGGGDKTIKAWNIKTYELLKTFIGHTNWVYSVSMSYDCKSFISTSEDYTIKWWHISTGRHIRTIKIDSSRPLVV